MHIHPPRKRLSREELLQAGVAFEKQTRFAEAERLYRLVLACEPQSFDGLHRLGVVVAQQGRLDEAVRLVRKSLSRNPRSAHAHTNLGNMLAALKRPQAAIRHYERALAIEPALAEAHNNMAVALQAVDRLDEAIAHCREALRLRSDYADAHNNIGGLLRHRDQLADAIAHFKQAVAINPAYVEAYNNLGSALLALSRPKEAAASCSRALALKPDFADAHHCLADALVALERYGDAIVHYERALQGNADPAELHHKIGIALERVRRPADALTHFCKALALRPDNAAAWSGAGTVLLRSGDLQEARRAFMQAVTLEPKAPGFFNNLVQASLRLAADDPHLARMELMARDATALPQGEQMLLHFALGKVYADLERHEDAFRHLAQGNFLKRQQIGYDEAETLRLFSAIEAAFDRPFIQRNRGRGNPSSIPIFVLGMPRSGTTLVEQIIASHPRAFGAGELADFIDETTRITGPMTAAAAFPERLRVNVEERLHEIAARYLHRLRAHAPTAERITDKLPDNFRLVGLIHLALPNARIIHTQRHPVDTCLSCFSQIFASKLPYVYDLGELGRYYRAYQRLMAHWRTVLPEGVMIDVQYESLVSNFEAEARRIIAHCGLDWDPACLDFHKTRRPVNTASAAQVRQPVYQGSVGRWQPYKDLLRPLLDELG